MKVHVIYTSPEVQVENSEEICKDIVNDIVDKMFMQKNSTLEITHEEQHDQPTLKRKLTNDDEEYQSNIKKKYKIDVGDLKKAMEKENDEYNYKLAFGEAIEKVLREGKVNQASLSKDKKEALEAYRERNVKQLDEKELEYENDEDSDNDEDSENDEESENENEMNVEEESEDEIVSEDGKFDICNDYSDIWVCYNCNRWETDERCQICNNEALELYERERINLTR